ncbi:MAG: peptidoglycan DD-metalloendopeptidase family protein [Patescibacteria group bacterium]
MKKWLGIIISFLFIFGLFKHSLSFAQNQDECAEKSGQAKISCYEEVLHRLQGKAQTLSNEITRRKTQIKLTTTKISQTEEQIKLLTEKIARLEVSLDSLAGILGKRIAATYKKGSLDPLALFFSSKRFSEFIERFKYLKVMQLHDRKLLFSMEETRTNYDEQKQAVEALKKKLEEQKITLAKQQKEMEFLLEQTKSQEKIYQDLLARALAEQAATKRAIAQAIEELQSGKGEPIAQGDQVALLGNSGGPDCSTGPHLHFAILKDGNPQDPATFLRSIPVTWDNQPDGPFPFSGSMDWPILNPKITQGFGMTYYARLGWYGGNIHDGIDMVSDDLTIRAPKEGKIIRGSTTCDSPRISGVSTLKFAAIGHPDGIITIYLHIQ